MNLEDEVRILIEPLLRDFGVDLFDIVWGGGRLKVTVDAPGGIDTTLLSKVSRTISQELDIHDPVPSRYTLEVSSPGLERRLRRPEHYVKSIGSAVTVKLQGGNSRLQGTIVDADDQTVTLKLSLSDSTGPKVSAGASGQEAASGQATIQSIPYADIARAQTVFVWPAGSSDSGQAHDGPAHDSGPAHSSSPAHDGPAYSGGPADSGPDSNSGGGA